MAIRSIIASSGVVFAAAALLAPCAAAGSLPGYPPSLAENIRGTAEVVLERLPGIDLAKVEEEDLKREQDGMAPRFAVPIDVHLMPTETVGTWDTLPDGRVIWRHRISSPEALSLNFGFTRFHLPPTAELWLYTPGYDQILGPFTEYDNDVHRQLWTPVLLSDEVILELAVSPEFLPYLELELTESTIMEHVDGTIETLLALRKLGVHLSIDDFGTGYSSMAYLKRFTIDKLKIDQSFVHDLAVDSDDAAIVTATIAMAHALNLTVIAEGVETEQQLQFLKDNGCEQMQGYYFSRPVPAEEATELLRSGRRLAVKTVEESAPGAVALPLTDTG